MACFKFGIAHRHVHSILLQTLTERKHICGVSVVDNSFERLKRYNISEIFDPTPKDEVK